MMNGGKNALNFATAPGSLWSMHWLSSDKPVNGKSPCLIPISSLLPNKPFFSC